MRISLRSAFALALVSIAFLLNGRAQETAPPPLAKGAFGSPYFTTKAETAGGASGSLVKFGLNSKFILSALHLLGPMGGFKKEMAAADVPDQVSAIKLDSFTGGSAHYQVKGIAVPFNEADKGAPLNEFIMFLVTSNVPDDLGATVATKLPAVGETVWAIALTRSSKGKNDYIHSAKVVAAPDSNGWLLIHFDDEKIVTTGASGSGVINAAGELVGVYQGHGTYQGKKASFIIPCTAFTPLLQAAAP